VQNAQDQGKAVGIAVAGGEHLPDCVPRFWSDQFDTRLQTVGLSTGCDQVVVRGSVDEGKFSAFQYRGGSLIAVDGINSPGEQMVARRLIRLGLSPSPEQAADKSFDLKSLLKTAEQTGASAGTTSIPPQ
jgi:3-phenylpropionate/trans-cinnamate dioxygenase ferredoxin reductase subunit